MLVTNRHHACTWCGRCRSERPGNYCTECEDFVCERETDCDALVWPEVGKYDDCLQCGQSRESVRASQRNRDPLYCATVDYDGECLADWDRHKFVWTDAEERRRLEHRAGKL